MNADIGLSPAAGQNPLISNPPTSPTDSAAASPTKQVDAKGSIQPKFEWGDLWRSIEPVFKHIVGVYGPIAGEGFTQGAKFTADWAVKNPGSSPNIFQVFAAANDQADKAGHTGEYKIAFTTGFVAGAFAAKTVIGTGRPPTFNDVQFHLKLIDERYQGKPFVPDIRYVPEPSRQGTPSSTRQ
jgi:hypothetical protein